jgi:DNA replication protein DnaD
LNNNVNQYKSKIDNIMQEIQKTIATEKKLDAELVQASGNPNAVTSFENANKAEISQLNCNYFYENIHRFLTPFRAPGDIQRILYHAPGVVGPIPKNW